MSDELTEHFKHCLRKLERIDFYQRISWVVSWEWHLVSACKKLNENRLQNAIDSCSSIQFSPLCSFFFHTQFQKKEKKILAVDSTYLPCRTHLIKLWNVIFPFWWPFNWQKIDCVEMASASWKQSDVTFSPSLLSSICHMCLCPCLREWLLKC